MRQPKQAETEESIHSRLHSAPKGLLRHFILHKIAQKPIHGYEVIQEIDSKTEGAWRPGAGSLYPILKKMESEGLIKSDQKPGEEATRRMYHITPKGEHSLAESKSMFTNFQQRWGFLRGLFIELIDPEDVPRWFVENSNRQFQFTREIIETKSDKIPPADIDYMMKEYVLGLERQLGWANKILNDIKPKIVATPGRQKGTKQQ